MSSASSISSQARVQTESGTSKKRLVSVNKIKPCQPPQILKNFIKQAESPADLLRHLNDKLAVSTPIYRLSGLMRDSIAGRRPSSKIRILSKDPMARRPVNPK